MIYPLVIATFLDYLSMPKWLVIIFYLISLIGAIGMVIAGLTK